MKKHFNKEVVITKKDNEDFKSCTKELLKSFVMMIMLKVMLKQEIIVISLVNIEVLHIDIVISIIN